MAVPEIDPQVNMLGSELRIQTIQQSGLTWLNIERPTITEMNYLQEQYKFHSLDLEDCMSRIQRPKIDEYDDYVFILLHFPRFHKDTRTMLPSQVCLFVGGDYLVSVHSGELKPLSGLFRRSSSDSSYCYELMKNGAGYLLYSIIDVLVDYCYPILDKIDSNLEEMEEKVFQTMDIETAKDTLLVRRNITAFRRIIRPQMKVLNSLEHKKWEFLPRNTDEDLDVYFGNIGDHLNKIWDMLEEYRDDINTISDISNWLASHRIQEVMRLFTVVAAIVSPMLIVPSIYGMNVPLPLGNSKLGLPVLVGIMVLLFILIVRFVRKRGWL